STLTANNLCRSAGLAALLASAVSTTAACNYCLPGLSEGENAPGLFPGYTPPLSSFILHASMKWCGVQGSPAVDNPSLVCAPNFKTMMLNRSDRASQYIWCP